MSQDPFYDQGTATVRFWVPVGERVVGASIGRAILHYRYHSNSVGDDPLATYVQHSAEIDDAVRRRIAAGSRDPVILQDADVTAAAASRSA
jgi:hypothetical protein